MNKILATLLITLISLISYGQTEVDAITYESYNNAKNTYNFTYWNSNWKTSNISTRHFTNHTSSYNLSVNYTKLSINSLNINTKDTKPSDGFYESYGETFTTSQPGDIDVKILKDGAVFNELNASAPTREGSKIGQLAAYGTWCNRRMIDSLNFTNNAGVYGSYTGVEFTNWHNRFRIAFQLKLREDITDGQMQLTFEMPQAYSEVFYADGIYGFATGKEGNGFAVKGGITCDAITVCGNTITLTTSSKTLLADTQYTLSLIFYAVKDNFCSTFVNTADDGQNLSITTSQTAPDATSSAPVSYSSDEGIYFIDVPSYNMGYNDGDNIDLLQNINVEITNNEPVSKRVRLCFYDNSHKNVTGFSSMIRNANGDPSGIPMQITKNWHNSYELLYSAHPSSYAKEYTELIIPANTTQKFDYTRVGAMWGNTFAASSHQLCVVGAGVPRGGWLQAALGSFGESITHSPDYEYGNTNACDYRPFLVTNQEDGLESKEYGWTGNLGGLDLFRYHNVSNTRIYQSQVKTRFQKYGPNLTETEIGTYSSDKAMKMNYTFQLQRSDDYLRVYYKIKVKVLKEVTAERFDIFTLGSDNYNLLKAQDVVYGDSSGKLGQFAPTNSTINDYTTPPIALTGENPWLWAGDGIYTRTMSGIAINGNNSMIIRSYQASFNGVENNTPYFRERVSSSGSGGSVNPTSYCIVPPADVTSFAAGDSIEMLLEVCLLPKTASYYYGPNTNFKNALTTYGNSWEMVHREALNNDIQASSTTNVVHQSYPLTVEAVDNKAEVTVTGGLGYVPIVFSHLTNIDEPQLWVVKDGVKTLVDQSNHGNDFWQTDYDVETGLYEIIYNVNQDVADGSTATYTYEFETASSEGPNSAVAPVLALPEQCSIFKQINTSLVCHQPGVSSYSNVAPYGVASQSSTDYEGYASLANDGNTSGRYGDKTVTHTAGGEVDVWWQVDLGAAYSIDEIKVYNRTDCCSDRMVDFTVLILNGNGETVFSQFYSDYPDPSIAIDAGGVLGNIVKIEKVGGVLNIAEVEVYNSSPDLGFVINDQNTGANLPNVLLDINEAQYATNDDGAVLVGLSSGLYDYTLSAYGYHPFSEQINLSKDTTLLIDLAPIEEYTVTYVVKDVNTLIPLQRAEITVDDTTIITNEQGSVSMPLLEGNYDFSINKEGYRTFSQNLSLSQDTTLTVLVTPKEFYTTTFMVKDANTMEDISSVAISINDTIIETDAQGVASIDLIEGELSYALSHERYNTLTQNSTIASDTTLSIIMTKKMHLLLFQMKDADTGDRLEGASVSINDTVYKTDAQGDVSMYLFDGDYTYTLSKEGYITHLDSLILSEDETIRYKLEPSPSSIDENEDITKDIKLYPSPANSIINIETINTDLVEIEIFNSTGQVVLTGVLSKGKGTFNIKELRSGFYIVKADIKGKQVLKTFIIK